MQLTLSIAIMQVPTSVAIMQFLRFYCNYAGGALCYIYVGGLFVTIMQVTVSVAIMQLEVSAAFMQVKVSTAIIWVTIFIETMQVWACCNYAGSIFYSELCTWLFLLQLCRWLFLLIPIFHKTDQKASEGIRHYIKFTLHHFSQYSSKIKILCG